MNITKDNLLKVCNTPTTEEKLNKIFVSNHKKHPLVLQALIHKMISKNKLTKLFVNNEVFYETTSDSTYDR